MASSYYLKGLIYYTEGKDKEALDNVNKALRYNGGNVQALALGGDILRRNGSYSKAIEPYEKVVRAKRADERVLLSLAECYCRVNNYKLLEQISSLLHEQGRDKEALQKIELRALIQQKRMEDAEKLLKQMNGVKEDSEFVLLRALCELAAGRRATATEMAQKAVNWTRRTGRRLNYSVSCRKKWRFGNKTIINEKICVIIPCYNEAQRLELEVFREFVGREERFDFCFVNDGSQDNTSEVLRRAVELEPGRFLLVDNADNRGKAEAVRSGMLYVSSLNRYNIVGYLDADLATPLEDLYLLAEVMDRKPGCA